LLHQELKTDVTLLDAHSFTWMLTAQMKGIDRPISREYKQLSQKEKEALIKARLGQGQFRKELISYWTCCAVTGCEEIKLLRASHIKPWKNCDLKEAVDLFNGLLLAPSVDAAFDKGYISFSDSGDILISEDLQNSDASALGIDKACRLRRVDKNHIPYLEYHREIIFKKAYKDKRSSDDVLVNDEDSF